jgi:hypothetical protein
MSWSACSLASDPLMAAEVEAAVFSFDIFQICSANEGISHYCSRTCNTDYKKSQAVQKPLTRTTPNRIYITMQVVLALHHANATTKRVINRNAILVEQKLAVVRADE